MVDLGEKLDGLLPGAVDRNVYMSKISRWRIGGPVDFLVRPQSVDELASLISLLDRSETNWIAVGHSSNLLFSDSGLRGVVVVIADNLAGFRREGDQIVVQGGHWVPSLARRLMQEGLAGAEHIVGIPGTIGGLICMNGGSMRKSIGANVVHVDCLDRHGTRIRLTQDDCQFSYRKSEIQARSLVVAEARLVFQPGDPSEIRSQMRSILRSRRLKFPLKQPNCGSVFVSDPKMYEKYGPPGAVIEKCGLKGFQIGDAQISPAHANFIVNRGNATAVDTLRLIRLIREKAMETFDCDLLCEVRYVGEDCATLPAHQVPVQLHASQDCQ
ncbi:UDP-N-acetylenolpyruvoylglucosamine reductase [Rhodopirellula sp. MGV]|nr:UDP-N-acetylenolpyruvoylglucosamine reductase [Rhodopirellula sp. MGV]PNY35623.1 UDP-N-acetylmuramate dehydrogenase [Rhodopirellula baltica]PNY37357.1 UDP-N-acetylmuramate dehydrogenase [Rhodopirellula baltica]